jgi:protein-S-isoprenylcysteine O-methyltransferase Ste14
MQFWTHTEVKPATLLAFLIGSALFIGAVLLKRVGQARGEGTGTAPPAQRDWTSLGGVLIQSLAIALVGGPARGVGSSLLDGIAAPRTWITALTIGGAVGLFFWAARTMGANWSIMARMRQGHELVTSGPFALVRHPIYLAMLLFMLSLATATAHESALWAAVPVFVVGTLIRTTREEALLRAEFGAAYNAYAARVKRFIPGVL